MSEEKEQAAEANRLYWNNEASVGEISTRLGISRRALYDMLVPRAAGFDCPDCGIPMVYVNRSALNSGTAKCPSCEAEKAGPAALSDSPSEPVPTRNSTPVGANGKSSTRLALGSIALMGMVVGAIATLAVTRKRR